MSDATIGIKIADGSYYPVLERGFTGRKILTLTTVKDDQEKVQIDLYRGDGATLAQARYIGSLVIDNIPAARKGEPDIDLVIGVDTEGELYAEASDVSTGESQKFGTSLGVLPPQDTLREPEFALDDEPQKEPVVEEQPLTGEAYPVGEPERRRESRPRKGPNVFLLVLFVLLGVALIAAIAWFVYRGLQGAQAAPIAATPAPAAAQPAPAPAAESKPAATASAASASTSGAKGAVTYRIKRGDTLWDIAATYYRNPWLYPRLAKANSIRNPDLIFAGTRIIIPAN